MVKKVRGASSRTRTNDHEITNFELYQLSYGGFYAKNTIYIDRFFFVSGFIYLYFIKVCNYF